ncbi:putative Cell division protein ftsj [Paragonimus heterotremus]|uniref:rRNA methyltransferase 2, mitochondrial n=1 Tax=Paragonimus heterotremus TaxID=100268 RepID=A0A8J4SNM9_9TREM|nr:putative Cell division protein ftsj [Paragonimus heterotremus]
MNSARSLPGRPFLHWIGLHVIFLSLLLFLSLCLSPSGGWFVSHVLSFAWLILVAFVSHVMRDARHRGLWIWPPPNRHTWTTHASSQLNAHLQIWQTSPLPLLPVYLLSIFMRWLMRQRCDPYVRRARIESYRCRSAFKLLQLHELIPQGLFHSGDIVVDCGAAPGSWSQVAVSHVCPLKSQPSMVSSMSPKPGLVIALDLLDFAPIPGVIRHQRTDLRDSSNCARLVEQSIAEHSDNPTAKVNVMLSDMAPNASGLRKLDIPSMMILAHSVLQLAIRVSAPGACLVVKLWECQEAESFKKLVSRFYVGPWDLKSTNEKEGSSSSVQFVKPNASRKDSSEIYLVARGFCLPILTVG